MVYFTSDLHLGHRNIIKYRDVFNDRREHDNHILDMISKLNKRDLLYIIGDFIFDSEDYDYYIREFEKMPCRIKLVMGNHDSMKLYKENRFEIQLPLFSYKNHWISHCPIHPQELRGRLGNIHGHLHKGVVENDSRYFNVNLDVNNYSIVSLDKIKHHFSTENAIQKPDFPIGSLKRNMLFDLNKL